MNRRQLVLALAAACAGAPAAAPPDPGAAPGSVRVLQPWEPFDPAFTGCEGG